MNHHMMAWIIYGEKDKSAMLNFQSMDVSWNVIEPFMQVQWPPPPPPPPNIKKTPSPPAKSILAWHLNEIVKAKFVDFFPFLFL